MRFPFPLAFAAALAWSPLAQAIELEFGGSPEGDAGASQTDASHGAAAAAKSVTRAPPGELPPRAQANEKSSVGPLKIDLHGSAVFWYYQPLDRESIQGAPDNSLELYQASLEFTGRVNQFGLYVNPRFRDSEAREFFTSNVWVEETYAFFESPYLNVKVGKLYNQFSRLWDDTFYGPILYGDGIKLDSDYGISLDGSVETSGGFAIGYYGQYFLVDGGTNGSLRDRDTVWVPNGVHRHHMTVLRLEPSFRFNETSSLRLGLAGEYMRVDFEDIPPSNVLRFAGDVSFSYDPVKVFAEFVAQSGQTVVDYPTEPKPAGLYPAQPGRASTHNQYVVAGAEVRFWRLMARYSFSLVRYRDMPVNETLHIPGVTFDLHDNISLMLEYARWQRTDADGKKTLLDNSLNAIVNARF